MRRKLVLLALVVPLLAQATLAQAAPVVLGPRLSLDLEDETELALGVEARFAVAPIGTAMTLQLRPSFDYYFYDYVRAFSLNLDALFAIDVGSPTVEPYVGFGLAFFFWDPEGPADGGSDVGLNLVVGARFLPYGRVQPFVELRPTFGDFDPVLLTGGVLFQL
jgi:hypothetical protein